MEIAVVVTRQAERNCVHYIVSNPWRVLSRESSIERSFRLHFDNCRINQADFSSPLLGRNPSLFIRAFRGTIFRMEAGLHVESWGTVESQVSSRAHSVEHGPDLRLARIYFLIVRREREREAGRDLCGDTVDVLRLERPRLDGFE